jgi:predicted PurR-regulated permease PerM
MMNHITLALVAVLAVAAAVVIGALASPAFADSSKTITKQINKQKQVISGDFSEGTQDASNCIAVLNGANACRQQANGPPAD